MSVVSELHQDHINLSKLLSLLEKSLAKVKLGDHPNFALMADVVGYISTYAEQQHHPREDSMYEYFKGRDGSLDGAMLACGAAHETLKGAGRAVLEIIDEILNDAVIPMNLFVEKLEAFVTNEKAHIDFEETQVFPLLKNLASESDWQELQQVLPTPLDPLFGEHCAAEYVELYKALTSDLN